MTPPPWLSLHAFHRGDHDRLITEAVAPLVTSLQSTGRLDQFFFIRYWEGGPHLRLRLLPTRSDLSADVAARARSALEGHLARFPSAWSGSADDYAALAERYARLEGLTDHDRRVRPPDVVEAVPYHPEYPVFGGRAATRAVERHFTDSSRLALSMLARPAAPGHRSRLAVLALATALAAWQPDRHRLAHLLTRSRTFWEPADGGREQRSERYRQQRDALRRLVSGCWPAEHRPPGDESPEHGATQHGAAEHVSSGQGDPLAASWTDSIHRLRAELADLHRAGDFRPDLGALTGRVEADGGPTHDEQRLLVVLLRCVHLLCNRLGLGGGQERQLRYLVCAACVDVDAQAP